MKYFNSHQSFDYLFADHEVFKIGELNAYNIPTPGHTPACLSYVVGDDAVFVGDTLFMPDYGTARCDFPKGSAAVLFDSVQKIYQLAPEMRVFLCHDYYQKTGQNTAAKAVCMRKNSRIFISTLVRKKKILSQCELSVTQIWLCPN